MRDTFAEINISNLIFNYLNVRKRVANRPVMAVVKADAYGHGMVEVVSALEKLEEKKPNYYGVALLEEGLELRKAKVTKSPILVFAPFKIDELKEYLKFKITPTITSDFEINQLRKEKLVKKLHVHVNIDTGMGRVGLPFENAILTIKKILQNKNILIDGIYTHFATSDEKDKTYAKLQLKRFLNIVEKLKEIIADVGLIHAANSGAILDIPNAHLDMVRLGISLYGYYPSFDTTESVKLKPVMNLISEVASINKVSKGTYISYGRKYKTTCDTKIISVPIGYADGIKRGLTNKFYSIIKNKKYHQVGTVTMDRIMFDVGNAKIKVGDKVILLGKSRNEEISANDWCEILDTIPYEITCGISKRVPRIYK
jgi:alanine racemase